MSIVDAIHGAISHAGYVEYKIKVDLSEKYVFCDLGVLPAMAGELKKAMLKAGIKDGVYEHNGIQFAIFSTNGDGSHPFHEADEINCPDDVLLNCDNYFLEDDPLDTCDVDSGIVALIPASLLQGDKKPIDIGPVIDLNRFDQDEYEECGLWQDSRMTFYASPKGIYVIDYFLARDLSTWKKS